MNIRTVLNRVALGSMIAASALAIDASAQKSMTDGAQKHVAVAGSNNLYCAGYVQSAPIDTTNKIVGGVEEQEMYSYSQNDFLYINVGANKGVKAGDMYAVVRPRGQVSTRWTSKSDLGFYVQEVGALEVVRVKNEVAVARVRTSCESIHLGDLIQPIQQRVSPRAHGGSLDRFADPSGKAVGRLFMGRDLREVLSRDQIVYIDLGADNNLQVGDRLTVFRPLGKGNFMYGPPESLSERQREYQSDIYRGGKFSNQATRKSGDKADGMAVTTEKAKSGRPEIRKIVGEVIVLNVKEKTATAVITKTAQEIHTGDWVELQ